MWESNPPGRLYVGIEPTREAPNPLQTVLKTARHTSTYLPPGRLVADGSLSAAHTYVILAKK